MIEFKQFIRECGYEPPNYELPINKYFRFGPRYCCWGFLFEDGLGGVFGNWKDDSRFVWQSKRAKYTPDECFQFNQRLKEAKAVEDAKREEAYAVAADRAAADFDAAGAVDPNHPYLVKKKIKAHGIKQAGDKLLIPVYSVMGDMQSLQTIDGTGKKRFMAGAKMAGGCHMIGLIIQDQPAVICEGYATGASLLESGFPFVIIAFNAGNLIHAAKALRKHLPHIEIVIAGDADEVGKAKAYEAAKAVGGKAIIPDFGDDKSSCLTDFNDLALLGKQ